MLSLLTLWLLQLLALNCPVSGQFLLSREAPVPCDPDSNTRTLFGIVSGCLATVSACTWVSVHPNVPGPETGSRRQAWPHAGGRYYTRINGGVCSQTVSRCSLVLKE
ncbi:hypothetical protein B0H14DRAFT_2582815 [Mycena olivaceomarginata]|nr:hypothetical protein B0H14DRAFT_2582815 [Mycena olivaceomarginata]